jgi:glyoxylase-like metal-dependent hydrolase (beta-lactamase superfamily II)
MILSDAPVCLACATQFPDGPPPASCPICEDERQFVRWAGQGWTTMRAIGEGHRLALSEEGGLLGIGLEPGFAIGQRALLVRTPEGCVLWDCVPLVTPEIVGLIEAAGGLRAIAISHPHYYTAMGAWSAAFGGAPIYLHADDRAHVMRPDPAIVHWEGERCTLLPGVTLVRCGGHFAGGTVLHWAEGAGSLLVGDILSVAQDRRHVAFMWSYPNYVPLGPAAVRQVAGAVEDLAYDRVYGAWTDRNIMADGKAAVARSAARHLAAISA